jgi:type IV pilus assembly protein PilB
VGLVSDEQLQDALAEQQSSGGKLGEVLVRELIVTEEQIASALAEQKGLAHINLTAVEIDPDVAALLPLRTARRRAIVPIKLEHDRLTLAMADPLDIEAIDEAEFTTGFKVDPVVASASQVRFAVEKYIAGTGALHELVVRDSAADKSATRDADEDDGVAVVRIVNQIIREAVIERASDVHFEPSESSIRVRYRVDGVLREAATLPKTSQAELLSRIKVMADLDITERRRPQDGRIDITAGAKSLDLRVATLPTPLGEAITIRILDSAVALHSIDDIGLARDDYAKVRRLLRNPHGALFVSGPTGSGKTTTLYALLNEVNDISRKVITVEDPIEFTMPGTTQIAVNTRVGLTFAAGLRTILRSDPDVVMVGEVRDPETAETAVRAALTGHLVLSSIHTNDAPSALTRLTDMDVPPYITSSGLLGAVSQRLVRKLCPYCRRPEEIEPALLLAHGFTEAEVAEGITAYEPVGCEECAKTGYRGRIGIFEIMEFEGDIVTRFLHNASAEELRRIALENGMKPLRRDALDKVKSGMTSIAEIDRVVV